MVCKVSGLRPSQLRTKYNSTEATCYTVRRAGIGFIRNISSDECSMYARVLSYYISASGYETGPSIK